MPELTRRERRRLLLSLTAHVLIVLLAADGLMRQLPSLGLGVFRYYTVLSNCFLLLGSALCAFYEAAILRGKRFFIPEWVSLLQYFAVCTVALTLFVVLFVLIPLGGGLRAAPFYLFSRTMLGHHLLCPLLGMAAFVLLDDSSLGDSRVPLCALAPTLLYAVVSVALNVLRVWRGPYPFLLVYEQPVWASCLWFAAIPGLAYVLARLIWRLHGRFADAEEASDGPLPPEERGWSADGYIVDQDCFHAYTYRTIPASTNACGAIAAYDLRRFDGQEAEFPAVLAEMDAMHALHIPGPTLLSVMRRYLRRYLPGWREVRGRDAALRAMKCARMCLLRYREQRVPHFVAAVRADEARLRFFNVCDGEEDVRLTPEAFLAAHYDGGPIRLIWWEG